MNHCKYNASSMAQLIACPASIPMRRFVPDSPDSVFSSLGTACDALLEKALSCGMTFADLDGFDFSSEDLDAVKSAYVYITSRLKANPHAVLHTQLKTIAADIDTECGGTADFFIVEPAANGDCKRLEVIDYKHGAGVPVYPTDNKQLMTYALGYFNETCQGCWPEVQLTIIQPRFPHKAGAVNSWYPTKEELEAFQQEAESAVFVSKQYEKDLDRGERLGPEDFEIGEHCQFCQVRPLCPAHQEKVLNIMESETIERERLPEILNNKRHVKQYLDKAEAFALEELKAGRKVEGWKLVKKYGVRVWKEDQSIIQGHLARLAGPIWSERLLDFFKEDRKTLRSPAQIEKLTGLDLKPFTERPEKGFSIAREEDYRRNENPVCEFEEVTE